MLQIKDLHVEYYKGKNVIPAVRGVSFEVLEGNSLGIVGESGCGKSTIARSIIRLIPPQEGKVVSGKILLDQENILCLKEKQLQRLRGEEIGMIFQDPFNSLNPLLTVEQQVSECIKYHDRRQKNEIYKKVRELLSTVKISDPERIARSYPHQLSGGLRQRVMIALAISRNPRILIADEPTTALDVTIQKEILQLLSELRSRFHMSLILITHNLAIVARNTINTVVMYAGKIVEEATTRQLFKDPKHPYTRALLSSLPSISSNKELKAIPGHPPDPMSIPRGCPFNVRCSSAHEPCFKIEPPLSLHEGRKVSCYLYE